TTSRPGVPERAPGLSSLGKGLSPKGTVPITAPKCETFLGTVPLGTVPALGPRERRPSAPRPITRLFAEPCANGVLENVETARLEPSLVIDDVDRIPSPEEVSVPVMTLVEPLRVAPVQDL